MDKSVKHFYTEFGSRTRIPCESKLSRNEIVSILIANIKRDDKAYFCDAFECNLKRDVVSSLEDKDVYAYYIETNGVEKCVFHAWRTSRIILKTARYFYSNHEGGILMPFQSKMTPNEIKEILIKNTVADNTVFQVRSLGYDITRYWVSNIGENEVFEFFVRENKTVVKLFSCSGLSKKLV